MSTVAEYIYNESIKAGMTHAGACALLGNIQEESGFKSDNLENRANDILGVTDEEYTRMVDDGTWTDFATDNGVRGGYGFIQVTLASRKQYFLDYMKARGKSIADVEGQVSFILWEMQSMYNSVWQVVTQSNDLYACTWKILDVYENPQEKVENMKRRYSYAQAFYQKFGSKGVSKMTQNEAIEKVLNVAKAEIGYHEKASNANLDNNTGNSGSGNWTKYARDLDAVGNFYNGPKNGYAWCDVFVDWCFVKAFGADIGRQMICQPLQSAGAGCLYSVQYYKQANRWVTYPQPGDQIFFSYSAGEVSHTGIVEAVSNGMVHTIEGNTSDQVARRSYPLASGSIVGYGRPKWELATGAAASAPVSTPAQTHPSASSLYSGTVLRRGSRGAEVKEYQEKLIKLGFDLGTYGADGDFGDATFRAVQNFQTKHRLVPVDGEIGKDTKFAINEAVKALNSSSPKAAPNVVVNSDSQQVVYGTPVSNAEKAFCAIGDVVNFTGSSYFKRADGGGRTACKPGKALVIGLSKNGKYPYQLCKINGYGSTVYGWVVFDQVAKVD